MKNYNWQWVNSTAIDKIAYDESDRELLVGFKNGTEYYFTCFPKALYEEFFDSFSKGEFFNKRIKNDYGCGRHR